MWPSDIKAKNATLKLFVNFFSRRQFTVDGIMSTAYGSAGNKNLESSRKLGRQRKKKRSLIHHPFHPGPRSSPEEGGREGGQEEGEFLMWTRRSRQRPILRDRTGRRRRHRGRTFTENTNSMVSSLLQRPGRFRQGMKSNKEINELRFLLFELGCRVKWHNEAAC